MSTKTGGGNKCQDSHGKRSTVAQRKQGEIQWKLDAIAGKELGSKTYDQDKQIYKKQAEIRAKQKKVFVSTTTITGRQVYGNKKVNIKTPPVKTCQIKEKVPAETSPKKKNKKGSTLVFSNSLQTLNRM